MLALSLHAAHVDADGTRVYYETGGNGEPALVLIHGWTCDLNSWRLQRPTLEKEFRVLAIDLPGHGRSGKPRVKYDAPLFARAVLAAARAAGINRAILVGHSMGVVVARQVLEQEPSLVAAFVSVDGAIFPPEVGATLRPLAAKMAGAEGMAFRAKFVNSMFTAATPQPVREQIAKTMLDAPEHVAVSAFEHAVAGDTWSAGPTSVPTLLFAQQRPQAAAREYPKQVFTNIVDVHEWPGVSHFRHMERVEEFNQILVRFARRYR